LRRTRKARANGASTRVDLGFHRDRRCRACNRESPVGNRCCARREAREELNACACHAREAFRRARGKHHLINNAIRRRDATRSREDFSTNGFARNKTTQCQDSVIACGGPSERRDQGWRHAICGKG
jgi:hypothetical protein